VLLDREDCWPWLLCRLGMALCTQTPSATPLLSGSWTRLLASAPEKDGGPRCILSFDQMQGIVEGISGILQG
jgi:hypothetical protein